MNSDEKQAIADAAKLMLEQLRSDRGKTSYWGRRWLDDHADDDIEVWLESVVEVFGAPPIKFGDAVTADNIGEMPVDSVIASPGACPVWRRPRGWYSDGDLLTTSEVRGVVMRGDAVVLRIGGGS